MFCPKCGNEVGEAKFCSNCGAPVSNPQNVAQPPAPTVQGRYPVQPSSPPAQNPYANQPSPPVPQGRYEIPPPRKKRRGCLTVFLIIVGIMVISVIVSIAQGPKSQPQEPASASSRESQADNISDTPSQASSESAPAYIAVGETVQGSEVEITVNGSTETDVIEASSGGYLSYTADEGNKYIVVNITLKNIDSRSFSYSVTDFQLYAEDGTKYSPSVLTVTTNENYFKYEGMNPGITETGNVAFNVPDSVSISDLHLQFRQFLSTENYDFSLS